jgi:hypothetical protein
VGGSAEEAEPSEGEGSVGDCLRLIGSLRGRGVGVARAWV